MSSPPVDDFLVLHVHHYTSLVLDNGPAFALVDGSVYTTSRSHIHRTTTDLTQQYRQPLSTHVYNLSAGHTKHTTRLWLSTSNSMHVLFINK
jgi:hypothetical protein